MNKSIVNKKVSYFLKVFTAGIAVASVGFGLNVEADDKTDYAFVITSDPQYPWTPKIDAGDLSETEDEVESVSNFLIHNQYDSINDYSSSIGNKVIQTFINGDITAYGHDWQWSFMDGALGTLKMPYSIGLGNHDIENNWGDTLYNAAWINSFNTLYNFQPRNEITKDTNTEYYDPDVKYTGSLDYSQKVGDFRMIMANNYPTMTNSWWQGNLDFWLTPGMDFLEKELSAAQNANQPAILYIHKPNDWKWDSDTSGRFKAMIEKYHNNGTLRAVFTGHYHYTVGKVNVGNGTSDYSQYFGDVPVYSSGSASQKTYLTAEVDQSNNEMRIYEVLGNVWSQRKLIDTVPINSNGLTQVSMKDIFEQRALFINKYNLKNFKINLIEGSGVLDDSGTSDDLIFYEDTGADNQTWKVECTEENAAFTIVNKENGDLMYEDDSKIDEFNKVKTGAVSKNDPKAQWRFFVRTTYHGEDAYVIQNVKSGKAMTVNSNSGYNSSDSYGDTIVTAPNFNGNTLAQLFLIETK